MTERPYPYPKSCEAITEPGIEDLDPLEEPISPYESIRVYRDHRNKGCSRCEYSWKVGRTSQESAYRCSNLRRPVGNRFMSAYEGCSLFKMVQAD